MQQRKLGDLNVWLTGGTDREGGGEGPILVLMHGYGAPGTDLVGLWRVLDVPRETRFVFPEAPLALPTPGAPPSPGWSAQHLPQPRAWWPLAQEHLDAIARGEGPTSDRSRELPAGMAPARQQVLEMLDALQSELHVPPERVLLGGFSQGAMLATDVVLMSDKPWAGLALMSSTWLAEEAWAPRLAARTGLRVLLSHGRADTVLSFAMAEKLRARLTQAGLDVRWVAFNGGHELPPSVLEALGGLVEETLYAAP